METQFQIVLNGQELQKDDVNLVAYVAAHADDRVLAEILRPGPYNGSVSKGILTYGNYQETYLPASQQALVLAGTKLSIQPFRAVIGSRAYGTGGQTYTNAFFRDIRSAYWSQPNDTFGLTPASNSSGNPRWDLVYAIVDVDHSAASVTRYYKDPTSKSVGPSSIVTNLSTNVTVALLQGTPGASPVVPGTPGDTPLTGRYFIPLAAVLIPDGFVSGSSAVSSRGVLDIAPVITIHRTMGTSNVMPASAQVTALQANWVSNTTRPPTYMPGTMIGSESRIVIIDLHSATHSHASGDIVDNSVDWRNRVFRWTMQRNSTGSVTTPWSNPVSLVQMIPQAGFNVGFGFGQSFLGDASSIWSSGPAGGRVAMATSGGSAWQTASTPGDFGLYIDGAGVMRLYKTGSADGAMYFIWIDGSAPFQNV